MLFSKKKYYIPKLSVATIFVTIFYLVFGPLFLSYDSNWVPKAEAATVTWVAGSTGTWETGTNWSTGVVPTTADDVVISSTTGNIAITLSSGQTANFNSLTIGGDTTYFATTTFTGNIGTGGSITVNTKGVLEQNNFVNQTITGNFVVASGGKATHRINTEQTHVQDKGFVFTAPNFNFQAGSLLDAAGKGFNQSTCEGGFGSGYGPGASFAVLNDHSPGASHGGSGGSDDDGNPGNLFAYGDLTAPYEHGSSAGKMHFDCGGSGGGTVKLTVSGGGTATISGTVTSTGTGGPAVNGRYGGGGSGGSVWINFTSGGTFTGSGTIGAAGGNALGSAFNGGGGGGGGRIAITGHSTDTYTGTFYYAGGVSGASSNTTLSSNGGAGTLYKKMSGAIYGDLYVDNGNIPDYVPTQTSSTISLANIWLNGRANLVISSSTSLTLSSSTLGRAMVSSTLEVNGSFSTPSTFTIPAYNQILASSTQISAITNLTVAANGYFELESMTTTSVWSIDTLTVSGYVTHRANSSTIEHALMVSSTSITVNSGGYITATGRGYAGGRTGALGNGPGGGSVASQYGGGGAYGGNGGRGNHASAIGGTLYGSTSTPEYEAGSGGGGGGSGTDASYGGGGGGIIKLVASTVTVNGTVNADGGVGNNTCGGIAGAGGGGAGGGVRIIATTLSGSGSISASGGAGSNSGTGCSGGGGGGGRILITATNNSYSGTVTSTGGSASTAGLALAGSSGSATIAPGVPYNLFSNATSAQTTSTNPIGLTTTTPFFSAIFYDVESGDTATKAQIQVSTSSSFTTVTHWDSGSNGTSITSCSIGSRCQDLKYGNFGTAPTLNLSLGDDQNENSQTVYYWRVRYFDAQGGAGAYSTSTATFTLMDAPNAPTTTTIASITSSSAAISWSDNSNFEDSYQVEVAVANTSTFAFVSTTAANTTSITTSTLRPNTLYQYRVKAVNTVSSSTYATSSAFYSLAAVAGKPTSTVSTASAISITIDGGDNPTSTTFAIYNETSDQYVAADGTLTGSPVYQTTSTWGADFVNTGLSPNTLYQYSVVARNGDGTASATSTVSDGTYTLAAIPTNVSGSSTAGSRSITISWDANSNPAGTVYNVDGFGNSLFSGDITETSYQFTGLVAGSTYSFRVRASNSSGRATSYTDVVSITLSADGGGGLPGGGGGPPPLPPDPEPDPFGDDHPPEDLEEFMPTGLIKIVSPFSGEVDLLREAGVTSPAKFVLNGNGTTAPGTSEIVKLQNPFVLDFSFDVQAHPYWPQAGNSNALFSKGSDYYFGFVGSKNSPAVTNNGFCFVANGGGDQICDDVFDRKEFAPNKRYDYSISWNGQVLSLYDGAKKLASKNVSNLSSSDAPLVLGGSSYVVNNKTYYNNYPTTIYKMQYKSEPILIYTNKPEVKLKIDATYSPELALKESDGGPSSDFNNATYNPINSELLWTLTGADGKKCINARFRSPQKNFTYDTFACAILDTIKPPATFAVYTGFDKAGIQTGSARISGKSESNAAVTIYLERFFDTTGASHVGDYGLSQQSGIRLANAVPDVRLAASAKTQFSVSANKDGTWQYDFGSPMAKGARYIVSVQTRDLAGNISNLESQDFVVAVVDKPCDPNTENCPEEPCDPETTTCDEEPEEDEDKPEEDKPEEDKPEEGEDDPVSGPEDRGPVGGENSTGGGESGGNTGSGPSLPTNSAGDSEVGFFENIYNTVVESVSAVYTQVRAILDDPRVQAFNKKVAVPLMATVALVNAAIGFQLPYLINLLRYLFSQPALLWRRRKQKTWGVVYNSYTKEPVDLATIRLLDVATGRVVTSQVTDFHGRYFMSTNKGQFKLEVVKPGFVGFSEHLKEKDEDTKYTNLYHGAAFYPPRDQFEINYNIPLDPLVENKPVAKILRDNLWEKLNYGLSFAGMAASLMSFVVTPTWYTFAFVCLHVGLFALFYRFSHHKLPPVWGVVREFGANVPIGRVIVRVFDSAYNKLVNTAVTDSEGRYAILVGPSVYYLSYEKVGYQKKISPTLDYSSKKTDGMGGIINRDELLEKAKPGKIVTGDPDPVVPVIEPDKKPLKPKTDLDKVAEDINNWKQNNY